MINCNADNHISNAKLDCLGEFKSVRALSTEDYDDADSLRVRKLFTQLDNQTVEFRTICGKEVWAKRCDWQFFDQYLDYKKPFLFYYQNGCWTNPDDPSGDKIDGYEIHLFVQK